MILSKQASRHKVIPFHSRVFRSLEYGTVIVKPSNLADRHVVCLTMGLRLANKVRSWIFTNVVHAILMLDPREPLGYCSPILP